MLVNCPVCQKKLLRVKYAGANVRECQECSGLLVSTSRAGKIERRVNKDVRQLLRELDSSLGTDTVDVIRCPECRSRMRKRTIKSLGIHVDDCHQCELSWFDGGELAALQLEFEQDPQTIELNRMRERLVNMTAEERKQYEADISRLRDLGSPMSQAVRGATLELSLRYCWARRN